MVETSTRTLQCVVVTPERALLDEPADFVALPMMDGELGVLPGRAALIGRLGCGELRIRRGDATHRYFVDGGFAQVRADTVTVLTSRALKESEINVHAVEEALQAALAPAANPQAQEEHRKAQARARAQLRMVQRSSEAPAGH
jgi:F-type H+-transporting ATPase subunit epsilon